MKYISQYNYDTKTEENSPSIVTLQKSMSLHCNILTEFSGGFKNNHDCYYVR